MAGTVNQRRYPMTRIEERLKVLAVVVSALTLAGCLVIPVGMFTEDPYSKEKLAPILVPGADRNLVRQKFGVPAHTRESQRYWFYTNQRATVGVLAGTGSAVFTDDDWLLVEFDRHGKVVLAEATDFKKCTSNGICLDAFEIYADPKNGPVQPKPPHEKECAVFLYLEKLPWLIGGGLAAGSVRYYIDGKPIGTVTSGGYLFLTHPEGSIQISAYDLAIATNCEGGKSLYVRAVKNTDWSAKTGEDLAPVSVVEGEQKIQLRHPSLHD